MLKNERLSPLLPSAERTPTVCLSRDNNKKILKTGFVFKQFVVFKCVNALRLGVPGFIYTAGSDLSVTAHSCKTKYWKHPWVK